MEAESFTVRSAYEYIKKELSGIYSDREIYNLGYLVLEHILSIKRHEMMLYPLRKLTHVESKAIKSIIDRLKQGEPVQHILGYVEFCDLELKVSPEAMIPRPETEELVYWILELLGNDKAVSSKHCTICDIGTGSGCIALSLKSRLSVSRVAGTDSSPEALNLARENAARHSLSVTFLLHDILTDEWPMAYASPDIIVSNPPYIPLRERPDLEVRVREFEPAGALFVPDDDPFLFYKAIAQKAFLQLSPGGRLFFEIHEACADRLGRLIKGKGFSAVTVKKDIHGKDRMLCAFKN